MPGLLQYQADLVLGSITAQYSPHNSNNPEDIDVWLPSRIAEAHHLHVCQEGLADIEEQIWTAQCYDALDAICHALTVKSWMTMFKNKNVHGQRDSLCSRSIIDRVHEKAREQAAKYCTSREAKYVLCGEGPWEEVLWVLLDGDIRGYQDKNALHIRKVDLGCLRMNKSRLLKALAVQGVLKMPKWRMVMEFPFGRRSNIVVMGLEKHARHSHGYGQPNHEL